MSILIVGTHGSMGKRYEAILRYLGKQFVGVDKEHNRHYVNEQAAKADGIIIATPTDTHAEYIERFAPLSKPILCEKPVTKSIDELNRLLETVKSHKTPFRMMYQYKVLATQSSIGKSHYDYFRHGSDGLVWDCLQIIGLARGELRLGEASPVWSCVINGRTLNLAHMDAAYIAYVQKWLQNPAQDLGEILAIHQKTADSAMKASTALAH